jgi:hypothetical protein
MAFDRDPMLTIYADKVKVRDFVGQRVGPEFLTEMYGFYPGIDNLSKSSIPRNFAMKSNHGSGGAVICWEGAPRGVKLPTKSDLAIWSRYLIHPDDLLWDDLVMLSNNWIKHNYYWELSRYPEWAYKDIEPQILIEEVLVQNGNIPVDFKFYMANAECLFIQVDSSRFTEHKRDLYSPAWEILEASFMFPRSGRTIERPVLFGQMYEVARGLSKGIDFVRVDLYSTDKGIKFGEMTNYPEGGTSDVSPKAFSKAVAKKWLQSY